MKFSALFVGLAAAASGANAIELTQDNFDAETAGKTVFIKFLAPWWGHCKKMKPDWDKLMEGAFFLFIIIIFYCLMKYYRRVSWCIGE